MCCISLKDGRGASCRRSRERTVIEMIGFCTVPNGVQSQAIPLANTDGWKWISNLGNVQITTDVGSRSSRGRPGASCRRSRERTVIEMIGFCTVPNGVQSQAIPLANTDGWKWISNLGNVQITTDVGSRSSRVSGSNGALCSSLRARGRAGLGVDDEYLTLG
ncbi:hypothetical protein SKAU_G00303670 [Synaphobranchus kaupii]|uniref:Uncharacterized protein n=1 Tax=Synaphobranchus kaupii TaxID=118154 RepID=A0A9Q1EW83_SYNKA|nr:hypothetical protein SKAU_G00303670 [Synaphobranchus kaupii]